MNLRVSELTIHKSHLRIPEMPQAQFESLVEDVRENGVMVPIEVIKGNVVIDGRCRLKAAMKANIATVPVRRIDLNGEDPFLYMLHSASRRRHMTDDQRACLAEEERAWRSARQRKGLSEDGKAGGRGRKTSHHGGVRFVWSEPAAARAHNVSERQLRKARALKESNPQAFEQVKRGELRLAQAASHTRKAVRRKQIAEKAKANPNVGKWKIVHGDCISQLAKLPAKSVRLIFADPPYNIGIDYGNGPNKDLLDGTQYLAWCKSWIDLCVKCLTDDGSLWVMICDEWADEFGLLLKQSGLSRRAWIKWYETFGVNCENNFNRCSRHIFYCVADKKSFVFNFDAVSRPSDRQEKYNDPRADPSGKVWDDVWQIPRLVGTSAERIPDFPTQIPLAITRAIVGCASDPGDIVVDPFSGSGSTGVACIELDREYIGIEKAKRFHDLSTMRLKGVGK